MATERGVCPGIGERGVCPGIGCGARARVMGHQVVPEFLFLFLLSRVAPLFDNPSMYSVVCAKAQAHTSVFM